MPITLLLALSTLLFSTGLGIVLTQSHMLSILIGIELMLHAANFNFVLFSNYDPEQQGHLFALLILAIVVCETAVALAIALQAYHRGQSLQLDESEPQEGN